MNRPQRFAIVYSPASARSVSRYVTRGFFSPRELPQAFARMLLTGEFGLFVGIPVVLLLAARLLSSHETPSLLLTMVAVVWLLAGLIRISRYGPSSGIGCYVINDDGSQGQLVGGLRMRFQRRARRLWIAGLLVEPSWRGAGIGTALMLAAFRVAQKRVSNGPVTISVFAPSHPASKAIIEKQLGGKQTITVTEPPAEELNSTIGQLEKALQRSPSTFDWLLSDAAVKM
ncbi:GNAT family N-acetyltransferase [Sideroxydans lithotrophicus]|uniref:GCN5-related N-acetyltransferase n=1 Tax=Sideroxydans lithotrophicus (strain ES-1) TaxID=580332 RepID=D5CS44_SIDLE|nr:GNAT family N-acetyltransferase [Sideroxydans lithotrophicus]ADE11780.1 GCN5-related N-acetyltransferase [Sideroxydans lithotrophicus ES-1]